MSLTTVAQVQEAVRAFLGLVPGGPQGPSSPVALVRAAPDELGLPASPDPEAVTAVALSVAACGGGSSGPPAPGGASPKPDFALSDVNEGSVTFGTEVSPRGHLGRDRRPCPAVVADASGPRLRLLGPGRVPQVPGLGGGDHGHCGLSRGRR